MTVDRFSLYLRAPGRSVLGVVVCIAAGLLAPRVVAAPPTEQAGVSSAVQGQVARTSTVADDAGQESLQVGSKVFMQDQVASKKESLAQLLLLDESTFKLGPDSSVVIDEFIYDPEQGTGEMVVEAASGVFRFISGAIGKSDPSDVEINTPLGTLGVRGTMVTVKIRRDAEGEPAETLYLLEGPGADNNALAQRGAIQVTAQGETVTVQRPGWGTFVRPGQPPTPPQPIPTDTVAALDNELAAAPSPGTGLNVPEIREAIRQSGADRVTGQTTARTRERGEATAEVDAAEAATREFASANELEDFQVPGAADRAAGDLTEFGNLQTFSGLRSVGSGTASASQNGVDLYRVSDLESLQTIDTESLDSGTFTELTDLNLQAEPRGSYDVAFNVDFAKKTFELTFDNINLEGFGNLKGQLSEGPADIQDLDTFAIFPATNSGGACLDAQCSGFVAALKNNTKALSGIISVFIEGTSEQQDQLVGVGITGAD